MRVGPTQDDVCVEEGAEDLLCSDISVHATDGDAEAEAFEVISENVDLWWRWSYPQVGHRRSKDPSNVRRSVEDIMVHQYELGDTHTCQLLGHRGAESTTPDDCHCERPDSVLYDAKRIALSSVRRRVGNGIRRAEEAQILANAYDPTNRLESFVSPEHARPAPRVDHSSGERAIKHGGEGGGKSHEGFPVHETETRRKGRIGVGVNEEQAGPCRDGPADRRGDVLGRGPEHAVALQFTRVCFEGE